MHPPPPLCLSLLIGTCLGAASAADQPLPFVHQLFSDHTVLQRDTVIPVWGWTEPGKTVTVSVDGGTVVSGEADAHGRWSVKIGPYAAGGPHTLAIGGPQQATISDVLFGDVWICSGQSNMEFGIGLANHGPEEIAKANYPQIRLFLTPHAVSAVPLEATPGHWDVCTSENIAKGGWGGFSAVGYFFGRDVYEKVHVPIGLIDSSWGGTLVEAWTSYDALSRNPDFKEQVEQNVKFKNAGPQDQAKQMDLWYVRNDPGTSGAWQDPAFNDSAWKSMKLPANWSQAGMGDFHGIAWFRLSVTLTADQIAQDAKLNLGPVDDRDTTYVNGTKVGAMDFFKDKRSYTVPKALLKAGANVIAVRILDTGGMAGINGEPAELHLDCPGHDPISLAGEWRYQPTTALDKTTLLPHLPLPGDPQVPTVLYNGMIAPLEPYALTGAIWYQGESNVGRAMQYRVLLPTMISDWRSHFGQGDFPFYIVQLANISVVDGQPNESGWADLREAQAMTAFSVKNCGMSSTIDIGDGNDIHPKDKQDVGERLALNALAKVYGQKIEYQGPIMAATKVEGTTIRVTYSHVAGGLVIRDLPGAPASSLVGFAIAGADHHYEWAEARIDGDTVVASSAKIPQPAFLRYAWGSNPRCNLYNKAGLPAVPFRTDAPK